MVFSCDALLEQIPALGLLRGDDDLARLVSGRSAASRRWIWTGLAWAPES